VALSSGADKRQAWERLLGENKLGALALLRNLRNMAEAKVSERAIREGLSKMKTERVLPFRFIAAARYAPQWETELEQAMFRSLKSQPRLPGKTILVVDTSGSMYGGGNVSRRSGMTRVDAAAALAVMLREVCAEPVIYCTAGNDSTRIHATAMVPPRRGFALASAITGDEMRSKIGGGGIFLVQCLDYIYGRESHADRIIVITDEQDCETRGKRPEEANAFGRRNYLINVASYKNGIGYGKWTHIDGWSEAVIDYVNAAEMKIQ
jgi:hypothetical protein